MLTSPSACTLTLGRWADCGLVQAQLGAEGLWLSQCGLGSVGVGAVCCDGLGACCLLQTPSACRFEGDITEFLGS